MSLETEQPALPGVEAGSGATQLAAQLGEKYQAGSGATFSGTPAKRGRGRPRKDGLPSGSAPTGKASVSSDPTKVADIPAQDAGYAIDKALVGKTVETVLGGVDVAVQRRVWGTAKALDCDDNLCKELVGTSAMSKDEGKLICDLSAILAEKYGLLTGYAPEILLGITLTGYSARVMLVLRRLNAIRIEVLEAKRDGFRKGANANPSQA